MRGAPFLLLAACNGILGIPEPTLVTGGNPDAQLRLDAAPADARLPDATPDAKVMVALHIDKTGGGAGNVTSDMGIACLDGCNAAEVTFELGTPVNLEAKPAPGNVFTGWDGACAGSYRFCSVTLDQARTVTARFVASYANVIFTTSQRMQANFGGLAKANMICDQAAKSVGLTGTFIPVLSETGMSFKDRFLVPGMGVAPRGFIRLDGLPVADTAADLFGGRHWYPVRLDENGAEDTSFAWTGTDRDGSAYLDHTCQNWSSIDPTIMGVWGGGGGGPGWLNDFWASCNFNAALLCVQIDKIQPLPPPPASTGKRIWVSKARFTPGGGGLLAANNLCAGEKPADATTVRALLPTTTQAASDMFKAGTLYVRPDGVPIGLGADISTSRMLSAPTVHADGTYATEPCCIIRGSATLTTKPTADQNCSNWSSASTSLKYTHGELQAGPGFWFGEGTFFDCSNANPIYCIED